ncbi:MAG: SAM-dependent methyltransferase [Lachnospiraceae bacterium]|nr:SAM-dependent methyltransferase [Lachnospiraceae bacterium]
MWIADQWKDYRLLDTGSGERLEQWGDYVLIRPDPQILWPGDRKNPLWNKPNARYHRSKSGGGNWEIRSLPEVWSISYRDLIFQLKPFSFKHTGLFPEQAVNWDWTGSLIKEAVKKDPDREIRILNLFAYTGGATIAAAAAGARVTHVDAARGMVTWAHENAIASGLEDAPIRWIVDDCIKFVNREIRRGNHYDGIIMDPPSYGRGPKGEIWKLEEEIYPLLAASVKLLTEKPLFFLLNSYTTGLQAGVLKYLLTKALDELREDPDAVLKASALVEADELGLPVESSSGLALPCGASGRVTFS